MLKQECLAHGGRFVFIGDIYTDKANGDSHFGTYSNAGVQAHPHDWSMAVIAQRVSTAVHQ